MKFMFFSIKYRYNDIKYRYIDILLEKNKLHLSRLFSAITLGIV